MKHDLPQSRRKTLLFGLFFGIVVACTLTPARGQTLGTEVQRALQTQDRVRVVVALKLVRSDLLLADVSGAVQQVQDQVMAGVTRDDFQVMRRYAAVPALAGTVTARGLATLLASPAVERVDLDAPGSAALGETVPHIRADVLHNSGLTGNGVTVAVLDSGIDSDHPDLSAALVGEACFCSNPCCPNGLPTQSGPGAAEDDNGHGTNVTGIITGRGHIAPIAVAPRTNIVAIKVLSAGAGFCCSSDVIAGLDYVLTYRPDVKVVNMSLGTFATFFGDCDNVTAFTASFAHVINALTRNGVSVFAASHNFALQDAMSAPACVANTISVGAVDDADSVAAFSNSGPTLDLLAPGVNVTAAGVFGGRSTYTGTSMASPHAAGTAALLLEAFPELTPVDILDSLKGTGVIRVDPKNGLFHPRIDAEAAFLALNTTPPAITAYEIVSRHSGQCLDVSGASTDAVAPVIQWPCNGGPNQQWQLEPVSDGAVRIIAHHSGQVLDVYGGLVDDVIPVMQFPWHGGDNQRWTVEPASNGYVFIVARHSGKVLDVEYGSTDDGARVIQYAVHGGANQQWLLRAVAPAAVRISTLNDREP